MEGAPSQQPRPQAQGLTNLIRPEQVSRLPHLNVQQKQAVEAQVSKLWEFINGNSNNTSDPKFQQAYTKLAQMSASLMQGMKAFNLQKKQQQAQGGQIPGQQQTQMAQSRPPAAQGQPAPNSIQFSQLQPEIQQKVNSQRFFYPPAIVEGTDDAELWLREAKVRFGQALQKAELARKKRGDLQRTVQQRTQAGNPLTQEEQNIYQTKVAQCNKAIAESSSFMEKFKEQQEQFKNAKPQNRFMQQAVPEGLGITAPGNNRPNGPKMSNANTQQGGEPQAHSISSAQAAARANQAPQEANAASSASQTQSTTGPQQTPVDSAQTPFNAQGSGASQQPGFQQPGMSRPSTSAGGSMAPGQPSSAVGTAPSGSIQASQSQPTTHAHPSSAHPSSAHPVPNPLNASSTLNGMGIKTHSAPIPKTLNVTEPKPVSMPPSRPTLNGGAGVGLPGQLAQPSLTVFPGYVLEQSEDGHLLSKKKLNELVREVMGPNSEDQLSPDAEEVCLQVIDDFIDDVIASGCKLAKLRGASSLEARDVQVVLERQYNIRIPGFSTDEVRTVRKSQPTTGWTHKMSAVQAAKLTGGGTAGMGLGNTG